MKVRILFILLVLCFFFINEKTALATDNDSCETDKTAPVITGYKDWNLLLGQTLPDFSEGIVVSDNCEQNTDLSIVTKYIDVNIEGTYRLIYIATDIHSNINQITVNVHVKKDIVPPELVGAQEIEIEVFSPLSKELFLSGVTAVDIVDGDLTSQIEVDYSQVNPSVVNTYEVIYKVTDQHRNMTTKKVNVRVVDRTKPGFILTPPTIEVRTDTVNWLDYLIVEDNYDSSPSITIIETVNLNEIGNYEVTYRIKDRFENETIAKMDVRVVDTTAPEIFVENVELDVFGEALDWYSLVLIEDNYDQNPFVEIDDSAVDYNQVGRYPVHIKVVDHSNNEAIMSFTVEIVDHEKPIIHNLHDFTVLIGTATPDFLENVEITDNYDQHIGIEKVIIDDKKIQFNVEGVYPLTFSVMDSSGNSTSQTVFVRMYDNVNPVFTHIRDFNIATTSKQVNLLKGVTAVDNLLGDISDSIYYDDSNIKYHEVGVYKLRYFVSDLSGNVEEAVVNVYVNYDLQNPVLFGLRDRTVEINTPITDWLDGVYAFDDYDQELTIEVDQSELNLFKTGQYPVTYRVMDDAGNITSESILVTILDTIQPRICGHKDQTIEINSTFNPLSGISVTDNSGETIPIQVDSQVDLTKLGTYSVSYTAIDTAGNTVTEAVTITVVDTISPVLTGFIDRVVELNSEFNLLEGITVSDNSGEKINVHVDSNVDITKIGTYNVTFSATDSSSNRVMKTIMVTVMDTTPPVFSGVKDKEIKAGSSFDPLEGIQVYDNGFNLTHKIIITSQYNVRKAGEYVITLSASDDSGNTTTTSYKLIVMNKSSLFMIVLIIFLSMSLLGLVFYYLNKKYRWLNKKVYSKLP